MIAPIIFQSSAIELNDGSLDNKFTLSQNQNNLDSMWAEKTKILNIPEDGASTMLFDYDNDGDKDIAIDNHLYINNGNGSFEKNQFIRFEDDRISLPQGSAIHADFNNDGYEDLVYGGGNNIMRLFINTCPKNDSTWFEMHEILDFNTLSDPEYSPDNLGISEGDFNDDEYIDLVASYRVSPSINKIAIFYNMNGTNFTRQDIYTNEHQYDKIGDIIEVDAADYDNDGDLDLLYTYNTVKLCTTRGNLAVNDQSVLHILYNNGEQQFGNETFISRRGMPILIGGNYVLLWREFQITLGVCRIHLKIESADYDNDGDIDFITGDQGGKVEYYENDGTGTFQNTKKYIGNIIDDYGYGSLGIDSADYDNDGDIDFIVCGSEANRWLPDGFCIYLTENKMIDT